MLWSSALALLHIQELLGSILGLQMRAFMIFPKIHVNIILGFAKYFSEKTGHFHFFSLKPEHLVKNRTQIKINKNEKSIMQYILNIEKFKHTKISSELLF
jgi:hypothetical protein